MKRWILKSNILILFAITNSSPFEQQKTISVFDRHKTLKGVEDQRQEIGWKNLKLLCLFEMEEEILIGIVLGNAPFLELFAFFELYSFLTFCLNPLGLLGFKNEIFVNFAET